MRLATPRIVSSLRARNINYFILQRWLARKTMSWADAVIVNSKSVRDHAIAEEGALPGRIHWIPNGIWVEDFARPMERSVLRAEIGPNSGWRRTAC